MIPASKAPGSATPSMRSARLNGTRLSWICAEGAGPSLVLLHGSWQDSHSWDPVLPRLARTHRVFALDRRGHGASAHDRGAVRDDVRDLAAFIEANALAPVYLVGNSSGASIALKLALDRPDLCRKIIAHEPPLLALLEDVPGASALLADVRRELSEVRALLEAARFEAAAEYFVEHVALGRGAWRQLAAAARGRFSAHAPTFLEELGDPDIETLDLAALAARSVPVVLTTGANSPAFFRRIIDHVRSTLPGARVHEFASAGHAPHATHPAEFVQLILDVTGASGAA